jgi:hydrogenase expression/formation protein HypC
LYQGFLGRYIEGMCLTVPRRVEKVQNNQALLQDGRWVSLALVGQVKPGDMLMAHANMAIEKIAPEQVGEMKEIMGGVDAD